MSDSNTGTCQNCKHFAALRNECHRKAPQAFLAAVRNDGPIFVGAWPPTRKEHWCSEHEPDIRLAN